MDKQDLNSWPHEFSKLNTFFFSARTRIHLPFNFSTFFDFCKRWVKEVVHSRHFKKKALAASKWKQHAAIRFCNDYTHNSRSESPSFFVGPSEKHLLSWPASCRVIIFIFKTQIAHRKHVTGQYGNFLR